MIQGTFLVFRQRNTVKSDFRQGQRFGAKDHLIPLKKPRKKPVWMLAEAWAALPDELIIGEFSVKGIVYVTTLINARTYPKKALAELYRQRWQVELDFRTIKTSMGMEMLRCKTAAMVDKEIAVHLLAYNMIRANLARAACLNVKLPRQLSFMAAVQLIRNTASLCIILAESVLIKLIPPLLIAMAQTEVGQRERPNQPWVVKRRPKAYPLMTKPRREYVSA